VKEKKICLAVLETFLPETFLIKHTWWDFLKRAWHSLWSGPSGIHRGATGFRGRRAKSIWSALEKSSAEWILAV